MAEYRPIKTKIWNDMWFLKLSTEERVVWFFLLTNSFVHISGLYELPKGLISGFTGITKDIDEILKKFENDGKVIYKDGWVFLRNYLKNQTKGINKKDNITKGIIAHLNENDFLIDMFNLRNEVSYKGLITPLGKVIKLESNKDESNKGFEESKNSSPTETIKPNKTTKKKKELTEEEKQLHKDVLELIDYFQKKYKDSMGKDLIITSWPRYIKQTKPFIKNLGLVRMKTLCDAYFIQFEDKFIKQNAWSLGIFLTDNIINSLNNKYS